MARQMGSQNFTDVYGDQPMLSVHRRATLTQITEKLMLVTGVRRHCASLLAGCRATKLQTDHSARADL